MKNFTSKNKIQFHNLVKFIFTNELAQFSYNEFYSIQKFQLWNKVDSAIKQLWRNSDIIIQQFSSSFVIMQYNEISIIPEYSVSFKPQLSMSEVTVEPNQVTETKKKHLGRN